MKALIWTGVAVCCIVCGAIGASSGNALSSIWRGPGRIWDRIPACIAEVAIRLVAYCAFIGLAIVLLHQIV